MLHQALQRMQQCYAQRVHFVELLDAAEADLLGQPLRMKTCRVIGVRQEIRPGISLDRYQQYASMWPKESFRCS